MASDVALLGISRIWTSNGVHLHDIPRNESANLTAKTLCKRGGRLTRRHLTLRCLEFRAYGLLTEFACEVSLETERTNFAAIARCEKRWEIHTTASDVVFA